MLLCLFPRTSARIQARGSFLQVDFYVVLVLKHCSTFLTRKTKGPPSSILISFLNSLSLKTRSL